MTDSKIVRKSCASFVVWGTLASWMSTGADAFVVKPPTGISAFNSNSIIGRDSSALSMAQRRGRPKGPLRTIEVKPTMNDEITYKEIRVVTPNPKGGKDEPLGIMSKADALGKAKDMGGLDLILINENSDPPVCKIVDYSKYRYMKEKQAKEKKKNSKGTEIKEVKMSYKIDVHDYGVRKKSATKFLNQGNRVKVTIMFRGREVQHDKLGFELIDKLAQDLDKLATKEGKPVREGRNLSVILTPRPEVVKSINDAKRKEEKAKKKAAEERKMKKAASTGIPELDGLEDELAEPEIDLNAVAAALEKNKDDDGDGDEDLASSLDDLLGGDDLTDDLFA
mmetsp:Transcript_14435/g.20344  ORF Transcript_14435/g.20344 Transcript_14435/m.20344 type:complete len:337 (-) Transcript_14435:168-1178(-)